MTIKALYPTVRPTLNLDFAKTKTLDPRITFTRASTATFVGANGLIQTAASGAPRFDHTPTTGESLGLLVEEARTNLLVYSQASAGWLATTMLDNTGIAPDGTNTAMLATDRTGFRYSLGPGTFTYSFFVKQGTSSTVRLIWSGYGGIDWTFTFATQSLAVVGAWSNASVVRYPSGWYRISATTSSRDLYHYDLFADSISSTFNLWGCQGEAGSFPTSYIPTTTATVTRAADVASMTGTNFSSWYRQDEGTMYLKAISKAEQYLLEIPTTGGGNYHGIAINSARAQLATVNSTTQASIFSPVGSYNLNVANSVCAAWAQNSFAITSNGTTVANDTSGTVPTVDLLAIGRRNLAGLNYSCSTFARLTYYPVRLPDAQLQALTAT